VVNGTGAMNGNVTNVQVLCTQPGFTIGGSVEAWSEATGDTLELQTMRATTSLLLGHDVQLSYSGDERRNIQCADVLPPNSQPQPCTEFYYTGIATSNVSSVIVDCQHNDWAWTTWYMDKTDVANNLPLRSPRHSFLKIWLHPNLNSPGGRDFAASWTDNQGRRWLFGGQGYPYPSPLGLQLPGLLNDLWVFDGSVGGWVPANVLTILPPGTSQWIVDPTALEFEEVSTTAGGPGSRWGSSSWTDSSGNLYLFGGQGFDSTPNLNPSLLMTCGNALRRFLPLIATAQEPVPAPGFWWEA